MSLLKTSVRYGSLWNGSFAGIFYVLKFPGWRVDLQKLNCQLARNTVIPETGMFITFYGRSGTQIHWDTLPVKLLPLYASVSSLETLREGWQVSTHRAVPIFQVMTFHTLHTDDPNHSPRPELSTLVKTVRTCGKAPSAAWDGWGSDVGRVAWLCSYTCVYLCNLFTNTLTFSSFIKMSGKGEKRKCRY